MNIEDCHKLFFNENIKILDAFIHAFNVVLKKYKHFSFKYNCNLNGEIINNYTKERKGSFDKIEFIQIHDMQIELGLFIESLLGF